MAVTIQTLENGPRNLVLKLFVSGANTTASVWTGAVTDPNMSLIQMQWSLTGGSAQILWDANVDDIAFDLCSGYGFFWLDDTPAPNPRSAGVTNNVFLTNGAGLTNGTIILKFKKT